MTQFFDYKILLVFILFVCTVVILYDFDKLENEGSTGKQYSKNVAGIINTKEIFYSKEKYKNILDKNVFINAKNAVFTPVKKPAPILTSNKIPFAVNGIFTSPQESIVMVSETQGSKTHFITVGESINDWKLELIDKSKVVFAGSNGEKNIFELNETKKK